MIQSLEETRNELQTELEYIFKDICDFYGDVSINITSYTSSEYPKRRRGKNVIKLDENGRLMYAMRMKFNTSQNEKDKIYWYNNKSGWSTTRQLLNEKNHILNLINRFLDKDEDIVTESDNKLIKSLFKDIELKIEHYRNSQDIVDVVNAIEKYNIDYLQNLISNNKKESELFWKLLFSQGKSGEQIKNKLNVKYKSDDIVLIRSVRKYYESEELKEYPCGVVVGKNKFESGFFVLRLPRCEKLNDTNYNWNRSDVTKKIGYEEDITDKSNYLIKNNGSYKVYSNLVIVRDNFDKRKSEIQNYFKNIIREDIFRLYNELYLDNYIVDINGIHKPVRKMGSEIHIDDNLTTEEIKMVQNRLNICEEDVRKIQRYRDIGRLSSNLRAEIVGNLIYNQIINQIVNSDAKKLYLYQEEVQDDVFSRFSIYRPRIPDVNSREYVIDMLIDDVKDLSHSSVDKISKIITKEYIKNTNDHKKIDPYDSIADDNVKFVVENCTVRSSNLVLNNKTFDKNRLSSIIISENGSEVNIKKNGENKFTFMLDKGFYEIRKLEQMYTSKFMQ